MSFAEEFKGKRIHIVHADMYKMWLLPGVLSRRDRDDLSEFFQKLKELKAAGIDYMSISKTEDTGGAMPGELVTIGGAILGCCPVDHGEFLENAGVEVEYADYLHWEGAVDGFSEGWLDLYEFILVPEQRVNIINRKLSRLHLPKIKSQNY